MSRAFIPLALALISLVSACESARPHKAAKASVTFRGPTLDDKELGLDDLRGQVVLVNVWATWCKPCRQELPELQRLHTEYGDRGFTVLGVSEDAVRAHPMLRQMVGQFQIRYPMILDPRGTAQRAFRVDGYPTSILLGRKGNELWRRAGLIEPDDAELRTALESALAAPMPAASEPGPQPG